MRYPAAAIAVAVLVLGTAPVARADDDTPVALERIVLSDTAQKHSLADLAGGQPVIVHFWATWCIPCRDELPAVDRFRAKLEAQSLANRLIVVSVDTRPYTAIAAFLADDLNLPELHSWQDISRVAGGTLRLFGYPATVLIGADAGIAARRSGAIDWDSADERAALIAHLTPRE
jgi:thiol-disulfide isomerase/thioredoxin